MMNFYLLDVTGLPDPKVDEMALLDIPDWRRAHIMKYLRERDRRLSLGAWRLMEKALLRHGFLASNVKIGANGKLECDGVYFNLSHSGDMVLCAVSDAPVGCDIEKATGAPFEVAERVFTKKERRYLLDAKNTGEANRRFFRLWTMKESYMKMTGEGLGLSPERIEVDLDTLSILRDSVIQSCILQNSALGDYEISVCMNCLSGQTCLPCIPTT